MTFSTHDTQSSVKALLTFFIDGKDISKEDVFLSLDDISMQADLAQAIDELYLISIYCYLSNFADTERVKSEVSIVDKKKGLLLSQGLKKEVASAKLALAKGLLGMEVEVEENLTSYSHIKFLSQLEDVTLLGALSFLAGLFLKNDALLNEGQKIGELILSFINKDGEVDLFFLMEKGIYKKDSLRASLFVVMSLYGAMVQSENCVALLSKLDPYQGGLFQSLDVENRLLCRLLESSLIKCSTLEKKCELNDEIDGLLRVKTEGFSFNTSLHGKVGIGSVSFQDELIVPSFGPHVLPLGKSDHYGLKAPLALNGSESDGCVSMWSRVSSDGSYGTAWIHSNVTCTETLTRIESFIWKGESEENLSLVFFLRGQQVRIENRVYKSGGLERASVETSKLDVEIGSKTMQIILRDPLVVEVIPLAGQEFFWNSDFIISFPFISHNVLSIDFVMD